MIAEKLGKSETTFQVSDSVGTTWDTEIRNSADLTTELKQDCFDLFELNMKQIYMNSPREYKSTQKKRELFHVNSRFILVFSPVDNEGARKPIKPVNQSTLQAFLMWRFVREETLNPGRDIDVAYCYEIQIRPESRRRGLGKVLIGLLENIGSSWLMKKVMLTVHNENVNALMFYKSLQFSPDEISPSQFDKQDAGADYEILSKTLSTSL